MDKIKIPIDVKALYTEAEQSPIVMALLSVIDTLNKQLESQSEKMDLLLAEIRRLKKRSDKPKIRASKLPKKPDDPDDSDANGTSSTGKRPGSAKKSKNKKLNIDREEIIKAEDVPPGAVRRGYHNYVVQDLMIKPMVVKYRLERWELPNGDYLIAQLPKDIKGHHFGSILRSYVLHQHYHQCVTQPLLLAQLREWKIDISAGQLNRLITENKEDFHAEKSSLLAAGLLTSKYIQVDDTGARHDGKNGYCTFIGNELFSWFESTDSKSRINFLELLRHGYTDYQLTEESFEYMHRHRVAPWVIKKIAEEKEIFWNNKNDFQLYLEKQSITNPRYKRLVKEAALIGSIIKHGFLLDAVIISDDAGQFNVLQHALCWFHAERGVNALIPSNDMQVNALESARKEIWNLYQLLLAYKQNPTKAQAIRIENRFDKLCKTKTIYHALNLALKRLYKNKEELLFVLKRPDIPLHNNLSERDIREYVKRRKISGSTRSDEGGRCRDTFVSLKKTALKMKISFWDYLIDRISKNGNIPSLNELILTGA